MKVKIVNAYSCDWYKVNDTFDVYEVDENRYRDYKTGKHIFKGDCKVVEEEKKYILLESLGCGMCVNIIGTKEELLNSKSINTNSIIYELGKKYNLKARLDIEEESD